MSALVEATELMKTIGSGVGTVGAQRRKAWIAVAQISDDFSWNRICDLHRGRPAARVSGNELNVLREAAARQQRAADERERLRALRLGGSGQQREARRDIEREIREALQEALRRVGRLEAHLRIVDPEFHCDDIAAAAASRQQLGEADRTAD